MKGETNDYNGKKTRKRELKPHLVGGGRNFEGEGERWGAVK